jgi:putative transposase
MYREKWKNYYFPSKPIILKDKWVRLRRIGQKDLSPQAQLKLEWLIFYFTVARKGATQTAAHFGISRKTLYKWLVRFDERNLVTLEERSRRPYHLRTWTVTPVEEERIVSLRLKHLKYGKQKLKRLYQKTYASSITLWKVERVVRHHGLFPDPKEHQKRAKIQRERCKRVRINDVPLNLITPGKLWHTDAIVLWWYGARRIIFTGLEHTTKLGYARVYQNHSSRSAADFLHRLNYLSDGDIRVIHSDNGSEFGGEFTRACQELHITQVYSRVRQPKDNAALERFNWTVQDEWLALSETGLDDIDAANQDLTDWLIEYNAYRPHQALDYQTPLEYAQQTYFKVLPMWSARTPP